MGSRRFALARTGNVEFDIITTAFRFITGVSSPGRGDDERRSECFLNEVPHLLNGHFSRFTTDKVLDVLRRLDRRVTIQISAHKPGERYPEIGFVLWGANRSGPSMWYRQSVLWKRGSRELRSLLPREADQ
jgi:hypothetical protein